MVRGEGRLPDELQLIDIPKTCQDAFTCGRGGDGSGAEVDPAQ